MDELDAKFWTTTAIKGTLWAGTTSAARTSHLGRKMAQRSCRVPLIVDSGANLRCGRTTHGAPGRERQAMRGRGSL